MSKAKPSDIPPAAKPRIKRIKPSASAPPVEAMGDPYDAVKRVDLRQQKRRDVADERRAQAERRYLEDDQRLQDRRARFPEMQSKVLDDLRKSAGQWQADSAKTAASEAVVPVSKRMRDNFLPIENRLRIIAGDELSDLNLDTPDAAFAKSLRGPLKDWLTHLGDLLDKFSGLLPTERNAAYLDSILPGGLGLVSRARDLERNLELLERGAAELADRAKSHVPKGRPRDFKVDVPVLNLAQIWQKVTGEYPGQSRDDNKGGGRDKGAFAWWAIRALSTLNPETAATLKGKKAPIAEALGRLTKEGLLPNQ